MIRRKEKKVMKIIQGMRMNLLKFRQFVSILGATIEIEEIPITVEEKKTIVTIQNLTFKEFEKVMDLCIDQFNEMTYNEIDKVWSVGVNNSLTMVLKL